MCLLIKAGSCVWIVVRLDILQKVVIAKQDAWDVQQNMPLKDVLKTSAVSIVEETTRHYQKNV